MSTLSNPCPFAKLVSASNRRCIRPFVDRTFGVEGPAVVEAEGQKFVVKKIVDKHGLTIGLRLWDANGKCLAAKSVSMLSPGLLFALLQNDSY